MLTETQILAWSEKAAKIAYSVLGLSCQYSVTLISNPDIIEDGLLDTQTNEIQVNLAKLEPFPLEAFPDRELNEEDRLVEENYRHILKVCYIAFHEMRHLYQIKTVEAYLINKSMAGRLAPQHESDKKCEIWLEGLKVDSEEVEGDANDFAYYLTNRFPVELPMARKSRRLAAIKRKYDKVPIPG